MKGKHTGSAQLSEQHFVRLAEALDFLMKLVLDSAKSRGHPREVNRSYTRSNISELACKTGCDNLANI